MPFLKIHYPIFDDFLEKQGALAAESPRRRSMWVICGGADHPVQALLNTFMPDSYARPHKHAIDETFEGVDGEFLIMLFDDEGKVITRHKLTQGGVFRVPADRWHTAVCLSAQGTIFETKECYYDESKDKTFAPFAPEEGSEGAAAYLEGLKK